MSESYKMKSKISLASLLEMASLGQWFRISGDGVQHQYIVETVQVILRNEEDKNWDLDGWSLRANPSYWGCGHTNYSIWRFVRSFFKVTLNLPAFIEKVQMKVFFAN